MSIVALFSGLSGVRAAQTAIDVASHNVANANTTGYTRQRVELSSAPSYQSPSGRVGTGVDVQAIARLRDAFLDDRFRAASADLAASNIRAELLGRAEAATGEPDNGLADSLGRLWDAAEAWANAPADAVERRRVLNELDAVSTRVRTIADDWQRLGVDAQDQRAARLADVDHTLNAIDELNSRLANTEQDRVGPDVLDRRDALLDDIARLTGAETWIDSSGRAQATLDGHALISTTGVATLSVDGDDIVIEPAGGGAPTALNVGGALGGAHDYLTVDHPRLLEQLDDVAAALVADINAANAAGVDADGLSGQPLLEFGDPNAPAATIRLRSDATDPSVLAAGDGPGDGSVIPEPHDDTGARGFAGLAFDAHPSRTGLSIQLAWEDTVVELAGSVRAAKLDRDVAGGIESGARLARSAEHGVSIDEEMVDLVRYQRALEAATRVMTTVDEALDVLVNRMGIVGR